jgi:hypothetical protein
MGQKYAGRHRPTPSRRSPRTSAAPLTGAATGVAVLALVAASSGGSFADSGRVEARPAPLAADERQASMTLDRATQAESVDRAISSKRVVAEELAARQAALAAAKQRAARDAQRRALAVKNKAIAEARANPKAAAAALLSDYGWTSGQLGCLVTLWQGESGWHWNAENASSGAYGIPQALPGSKMASAGADWRSNPVTQMRWGMGYIKTVYGSPCNALNRWNSRYPHWY